MQCDERRPLCSNCLVSQRECTFPGVPAEPSSAISASRGTPLPERSSPARAGALPAPQASGAGAGAPAIDPHAAAPSDSVNLLHAELLVHYSFIVSVPEFDRDLERAATKMVLKHALAFPWLLYEVLAISARHLAADAAAPEAVATYRAHASRLQTAALDLFNAETLVIDEANSSAVVLFSSILGRHLLADTLGCLVDGADLSAFLSQYAHYAQVHQGLRAVIADAKEILAGAEIWPLLTWSGFSRPRGKQKGIQLEPLRAWIESAPALTSSSPARGGHVDSDAVQTCLGAVDALQSGLDDALDAELPSFRRCQVATIWAVLCPKPFHKLLQRHHPPALVVLAHYAVLLHFAGDIWQINYTGKPLLRLVAEFLGPAYTEQLEWPWTAIGENETSPLPGRSTQITGEGRRRMTTRKRQRTTFS